MFQQQQLNQSPTPIESMSESPSTPSSATHKHKTMKLLAILGLCLASPTNGFAVKPASAAARTTVRSKRTPTHPLFTPLTTTIASAPLSMVPLPDFDLSLPTELLAFSNPNALNSNTNSNTNNLVQAEVMNGMTHALLDFASLFGGATLLVRLATVIGRLCVVGVDVGHATADASSVLPDELGIQLGLLGFAVYQVMNTAGPKIQAQWAPRLLTAADRQAYRMLFRPAGISWHQYRQLLVSAMDWVTVEPGQVIVDESPTSNNSNSQDAVYWLHQGDVEMFNTSDNAFLHQISSDHPKEVAGLGLLGEMKLANLLDRPRRVTTTENGDANSSKKKKKGQQKSTAMKAVAGPEGATLLRMNTAKLARLLRHDQELSSSMNRLAFKGMQDKLDALLLLNSSSSSSSSSGAP